VVHGLLRSTIRPGRWTIHAADPDGNTPPVTNAIPQIVLLYRAPGGKEMSPAGSADAP
jgi:hypothetical protein